MKKSNQSLSPGEKVKGLYFGHPFHGTLSRREVVNERVVNYYVRLEHPIDDRMSICFIADVRDELTGFSDRHFINHESEDSKLEAV